LIQWDGSPQVQPFLANQQAGQFWNLGYINQGVNMRMPALL
jgi:hypothetical protein